MFTGDKKDSSVKLEAVEFLANLDNLNKKDAAEFINKNKEAFQKCLTFLSTDENQAKEHPKALKRITSVIVQGSEFNETISDVIKISYRNHLMKSPDALHNAIKGYNVGVVAILLELGYSPNLLDDQGNPPLFYAMERDWSFDEQIKQIQELLLKHKDFDPNTVSKENISLVKKAHYYNNNLLIANLIEKGANTDLINDHFNFALDFASWNLKGEDAKLMKEKFMNLPGVREIKDPDVKFCLFEIWKSPINMNNVEISLENWNKVLDILSEDRHFAAHFPNLMTAILSGGVELHVPSERILKCLDSHPELLDSYHGKELMRSAVENGNLEFLREIVKRGVKPNECYGKPLNHRNLADSTPLHHALLSNKRDIAEFLINNETCPVSLSILNKDGKTPYEISDPKFLETHSSLILWLLDQEDISTEYKNALFAKVAADPDKGGWQLVAKLLETGAFLDSKQVLPLFESAIQSHQLSIVNSLLTRIDQSTYGFSPDDLINGISDTALRQLIEVKEQGWVQSQLAYLTEKGLRIDYYVNDKGNTLLAEAILKKNYSLAAFLISLGADLDKANLAGITPSQLLKKQNVNQEDLLIYAERLTTGTPAEQKLRQELFIKNLGHLLGDDFLSKLKSIQGQRLEGNTPSTSLSFMHRILDHLIEDEEIKEETREKLRVLSEQFAATIELAFQIEDIAQLNPTSPHLSSSIENISQGIYQKLDKLKEGESLLIPYGWAAIPSGHATMLVCKRVGEGYVFELINTGDGIKYHHTQTDKTKQRVDTVHSFFIPKEALEDKQLITQIISPKTLGSGVDKEKDRSFSDSDMYVVLKPYELDEEARKALESHLTSNWMKAQLSGTCSLRCLQAMVASLVGIEEYKPLKNLMNENVIQMAFELNQGLIKQDPPLAKILSETTPRLFSKVSRSLRRLPEHERTEELLKQKVGKLEKLERLHQQLTGAMPSRFSENSSITYEESLTTKTEQVKKSLAPISQVKNQEIETKGKPSNLPPLPTLELENLKTGKEVLTALSTFEEFILQMKRENKPCEGYAGIFLRDLGRLFVNEGHLQRTSILEDLKDIPTSMAVLNSLQTITDYYFDETGKNDEVGGMQLIALHSSLAVGWRVGILIDEQMKLPPECTLSHYGIDSRNFSQKLAYSDSVDFLPFPEMIDDFKALATFFAKTKASSSKPLFNFSQHGQITDQERMNFVALRSSTGDYHYAEAFASQSGDLKIKEEAQKALEEAEKKMEEKVKDLGKYKKIDSSDWTTHWFYLRGKLPEHFQVCRHLALLAHIGDPSHVTNSRSSKINYSGPILGTHPNAGKELLVSYSLDGIKRIGDNAKLMLDPQYRDGQTFFPTDMGKARYVQSDQDRAPYNFAIIAPMEQNEVLTHTTLHFHELLTLRSVFNRSLGNQDGSVPLTMLIDHFEENLQELTQKEARIIFATCLNHPMMLFETLKKNETLFFDLQAFFDEAMDHFQTQVLTNEDKKNSFQALLFLHEQKQRVLRTAIAANPSLLGVGEQLRQTRVDMRKLLSSPACTNPQDKQYLYLSLLDSFNVEVELSTQEVRELIQDRNELERILLESDPNKTIFPIVRNVAKTACTMHKIEIEKYLEDTGQRNRLFDELFQQFKIDTQGNDWKERGFPLYVCTVENDIYQIDVLTGETLKDGKPFSPLANLKYEQLYHQLFGDQILMGTQVGPNIESQDSHGKIRFIMEDMGYGRPFLDSVQREIDHHWYKYLPEKSKDYPLLPPLSDIEHLQVWQSADSDEFLLVDKRTMKPVYGLDGEGYFYFPPGPEAKRYEWAEISTLEQGLGIAHFDPQAILWKPAPKSPEESHSPLLVFPHYRDEQGNVLEFLLKDGRWESVASPHLKIAEKQVLKEISNFSRFLILDDKDGECEVFIPKQTLTQLNTDSSYISTCERIKLENGQALSRMPSKNAYLAYLTLAHAITPEDYEVALHYLKSSFSFERYSQEDLRVLGWIFNITKEKSDNSGSMDSLRLYAAWLVHDNFKRNPSSKIEAPRGVKTAIPLRNSPAAHWEAYWQNNWSWNKNEHRHDFRTQLDQLTRHYLARRSKVQHAVKLESILEPQELINWDFDKRTIEGTGIVAPAELPVDKGSYAISKYAVFSESPSKTKTPISFQMRPGKEFARQFHNLYQMAKSSRLEDRQKVERLINGMAYDSFPDNKGLRTILHAALIAKGGDPSKPGFAEAAGVVKIMDRDLIKARGGSVSLSSTPSELNSKLASFVSALPSPRPFIGVARQSIQAKPIAEIIPKHEPKVLPEDFPKRNQLVYKPTVGDLTKINQLHGEYLTQKTQSASSVSIEPFTFETEDSYIHTSLHELNHDYQEGAKKNHSVPVHELKSGVTLDGVVTDLKKTLKNTYDDDLKALENLKSEMLKLARTPPKGLEESIHERAAALARQKPEIGEPECIALFLQADPEEFKRMTNLTDEKEIEALYQVIGDYLSLSRKVSHLKSIQKDVSDLKDNLELKGSEDDQHALLQKIGNGLSQVKYVNPQIDPNAFLVLENGLDLFLKEDQVEGLRAMLPRVDQKKFPNVLLQRIQGGGKTLVFGHTMALVKADGYHLSFHVPPTPQYGTARYDMKHVSGKVFGQKERTLEFDDDPQRFTVEYLSWMRETMVTAVVNREYITATNETLRAIRCKYIKMRLIIELELIASNGEETEKIKNLEERTGILKDMLKIMRERGVFTFDEVHLAFDPKKELNMPFGDFSNVSIPQARVMAKLMAIAANSRDELGSLLKLHENQQSQQTESQYEKMLETVANQSLSDPVFLAELRILETDEKRLGLIKDYFTGKEENLPDFIAERTNPAIKVLKTFQVLEQIKAQCLTIDQNNREEFLKGIFDESTIKSTLNLNEETEALVKEYLIGNIKDLPEPLNMVKDQAQLIKDSADLIVLTKQMLAGKWIKDRISKSVDEHHGFPSTHEGPRVAIPYLANTRPAEGSEFSDRYVMITNTLMAYIVQGLSTEQVKELLEDLKKQAYIERRNQKEEQPDFKLADTKAAQEFTRVCGMDLFGVDKENSETIASIQKALLARNEEATNFLFDYVIKQVLPSVEIFNNQVCSHGRNTASMGQSLLGYSASLDNPNLAPPNTSIQPELGTNGQSVDLYIRQNDDVWAIKPISPGEKDSLIYDVIDKHPERDKIRSLIEVGCHFRGVPNEEVARMICKYLREINSPIKGVLFFHTDGTLCFMNKEHPEFPQKLSGTRPETIQKETGYPPNLLFTYYDQDHITGTDIKQAKDTIAVLTWSEHTKIHESFQGGRRLRELAMQQRLVSAVEQGSLGKMGSKLNKPSLTTVEVGKLDPSKGSIRDLILFSHLEEVESQREDNLLFCLQDIENTLQEFILDKLYQSPTHIERKLFTQASHLFVKNIAVDLYLEYAFKREKIPIEDYLIAVQKRLIAPLEQVLEKRETDELNLKFKEILTKALPGLHPKIEVSRAFVETNEGSTQRNSEGTMVQFREQQKETAKETAKEAERVQENVSQQENLSKAELSLMSTHKTAGQIALTQEHLENPSFAIDIQTYNGSNPCLGKKPQSSWDDAVCDVELWSLNQVLAVDQKSTNLFDSNLLMTSNFAIAWQKRVDLIGGFKKKPFQWLLISDESKGAKEWRLVLISAEDAIKINKHLNRAQMPEGRSMYLVRATSDLKLIASKGNKLEPEDLYEEPQVRKLVTEAMLLTGKVYPLSQRKWRNALDETLPRGESREVYQKFFEEKVLREKSSSYIDSPLYTVLHSAA